jgi:ketopantoate reductase
LREELTEVNQTLDRIIQGKSELFQEIYKQETSIPGVSLQPSWRWILGPADIQRDTARPDRLRLIVREIPGHEQEDFREMVRLVFQKEKLEVSLYPQLRYDYLLKIWLAFHIPLTAGLMIFSVIHIVAILYY